MAQAEAMNTTPTCSTSCIRHRIRLQNASCEETSARQGVGMLRPDIGTGGLLLGDVLDDGQCVGRAAKPDEHLCEEKSARQGVGMLRPKIGTGGLLLGDVLDDGQCVGRAAEPDEHLCEEKSARRCRDAAARHRDWRLASGRRPR